MATLCPKILIAILLLFFPVSFLYGEETIVDYPTGYRNWTHVKSGLIDKAHPLHESFGGIHHIYANDSALAALKTNTEFADDSVLVFDLLIAAPYKGGINEGERRRIDVMQRNSQKFGATGGWGFVSFVDSTEQRLDQDVVEKCFGCHEAQKENAYVFSEYRF